MTTATQNIARRAAHIAGACWDDRSEDMRLMPLATQIRAVAETPRLGTDGDLTDADVSALLALADEAA